jgi:hypothetical protein
MRGYLKHTISSGNKVLMHKSGGGNVSKNKALKLKMKKVKVSSNKDRNIDNFLFRRISSLPEDILNKVSDFIDAKTLFTSVKCVNKYCRAAFSSNFLDKRMACEINKIEIKKQSERIRAAKQKELDDRMREYGLDECTIS